MSEDVFLDDDFDELGDVLAEAARRRPSLTGALEDAAARQHVLTRLTKIREDLKITQRQVAERMQTTQSAVSELEGGGVDPRLSTLQRYARAVTARLLVSLDLPSDAAWCDAWMYERSVGATRVNVEQPPMRPSGYERDWARKAAIPAAGRIVRASIA